MVKTREPFISCKDHASRNYKDKRGKGKIHVQSAQRIAEGHISEHMVVEWGVA